MDEPYHLLAGVQALRHGSNDLNWEHPPLVKMIAALPLVFGPVPAVWEAPVRLEEALARSSDLFTDPERARWIRHASRALMLVVFAAPWLAACFLLGREVAGSSCGLSLVAILGLSAMVIPYLSLVQTDGAVALGFALTLLCALRHQRDPSARRAIALGAAIGLALAAKFSAVLLVPVVLLALLWPRAPRPPWKQRLAWAALAATVAVFVFWLPYAVSNRAHDPRAGEATLRTYCADRGTLLVAGELRPLEPRLLAIARVSPSLAQIWTGIAGIQAQNRLGVYPTFAFGEVTSRGRWWYFPALLAVRLSLVLLVVTGIALASRLRSARSRSRDSSINAHHLLSFAVVIFLTAAVLSSYNLGSRHLLPILPVLLLPAAHWMSLRRRRLVTVVLLLGLEAILLAPGWMAATNTWWLGNANPTRFAFGAGDMEYKQNLLELGREAERRGIRRLKVVFPGTGSAEVAASIPGAVASAPGDAVEPGWYAVSVLAERSLPAILRAPAEKLYLAERRRAAAREWVRLLEVVARGEDQGYVASSFHLYRVALLAATSRE